MNTMATLPTTKKPNAAPAPEPLLDDAFANFAAMRRAMLRSFFEPFRPRGEDGETLPAIDLYEKDGSYVVECALPGYKKDDVHVEASGDTVTINGSYHEEKKENGARYHRREMRRGSFARSVSLPQEIDADKVTANFENGMLTVTLPSTREIKSKTIPIAG